MKLLHESYRDNVDFNEENGKVILTYEFSKEADLDDNEKGTYSSLSDYEYEYELDYDDVLNMFDNYLSDVGNNKYGTEKFNEYSFLFDIDGWNYDQYEDWTANHLPEVLKKDEEFCKYLIKENRDIALERSEGRY